MKQFFLILSGLALLTGCSSKNDSVEGPVQSRIRIAPSISRVTGLNFDTGDRIGLTIVKSGANYCENTPLRFDGTVSYRSGRHSNSKSKLPTATGTPKHSRRPTCNPVRNMRSRR